MFSGKKLLITGGTGSFGSTMLRKIIKTNLREIRIFSRDEKKQEDLRKKFNNSNLKFIIGDIRDYSSVKNATKNIDFIFHAAALKQVPSCEFFPDQAIKTNTTGTLNIIEASIENNVKKLVCLSTDKAVYPINAMGMSKALMEKIALASCRNSTKNDYLCYQIWECYEFKRFGYSIICLTRSKKIYH
jgi:UDP-N-acetylglucosamine 4,6-dehydratase